MEERKIEGNGLGKLMLRNIEDNFRRKEFDCKFVDTNPKDITSYGGKRK